jgi:hypothetical protein
MLEVLVISFFAAGVCWFASIFIGAVSYARDMNSLRSEMHPEEANLKWGINPRAMRWLIPIVVVGITAYVLYLKYLGLV